MTEKTDDGVATEGHCPGAIDPSEAMREALGPARADRCLGRAGHVPGEAELANWEAYQRAVYGWPSPTGVSGITQHQQIVARSSSEAMLEFFAQLDQYGDAALGIEPGGLVTALRGSDEYANVPRLRITRRNNVVVEMGGHVVATALSTHGIKGRKARRAAAEEYLERRAGRRLTADEIIMGATGAAEPPRIDPLAN